MPRGAHLQVCNLAITFKHFVIVQDSSSETVLQECEGKNDL